MQKKTTKKRQPQNNNWRRYAIIGTAAVGGVGAVVVAPFVLSGN